MKTFFNSKTIRERVLMAAFILIGVLWWGSSLLGRTRSLQTEWKITDTDIEEQLNWLGKKAQVEERTAKISAQLDPSKTFNATQAFAEVNRLAQGLSRVDIGNQRTDKSENFAIHSLQMTIRQNSQGAVLKFYDELSRKVPYLYIDQCTITMDRTTPGQINATVRVYSVEILTPLAKP